MVLPRKAGGTGALSSDVLQRLRSWGGVATDAARRAMPQWLRSRHDVAIRERSDVAMGLMGVLRPIERASMVATPEGSVITVSAQPPQIIMVSATPSSTACRPSTVIQSSRASAGSLSFSRGVSRQVANGGKRQ